jgi:hypothetical protein
MVCLRLVEEYGVCGLGWYAPLQNSKVTALVDERATCGVYVMMSDGQAPADVDLCWNRMVNSAQVVNQKSTYGRHANDYSHLAICSAMPSHWLWDLPHVLWMLLRHTQQPWKRGAQNIRLLLKTCSTVNSERAAVDGSDTDDGDLW